MAGSGPSPVKGPARQSCLGCRRRKAKCCRTRPTCELCSRMGEKCEYNVKPAIPKPTEIAALEDRLQFVERLLSAQALFLAPFLSHVKYGGLPTIPACHMHKTSNRIADDSCDTDQASPSSLIQVIKRTTAAGVTLDSSTPTALSAFYLELGRRLEDNGAPCPPSTPLSEPCDPLSCAPPLLPNSRLVHLVDIEDELFCADQTASTPPLSGRSSLKRPLQTGDSYRNRAYPSTPPLPQNNGVSNCGESPRASPGREPWSGELVGKDVMEDVLRAYFAEVHPFLPIIHRLSFLTLIQEQTTRKPLLPILHSIVAITLPRLWPMHTKNIPEELRSLGDREEIATSARKKVISFSMDSPSLEVLQSLIILAVDGLGSRAQSRAWSFIGMLSRMAIQCQINRESVPSDRLQRSSQNTNSSCSETKSDTSTSISIVPMSLLQPPKDWVEAETRRRVFWAVVFLDRFSSAGTGLHVALNRRDLLCKLPASEQAYETSTEIPSRYMSPLSPFRFRPHPAVLEETDDCLEAPFSSLACLVEASEALGSVHQFILEAGGLGCRQRLTACQELDMKLIAWRSSLPANVQSAAPSTNGGSDPTVVMVHAMFNASVILLHQNFAYPAPAYSHLKTEANGMPVPMNPSKNCLSRCVSATRDMTSLIRLTAPYMTSQNPLLAFSLFVSARAILVHLKHQEIIKQPVAGNGRSKVRENEERDFKLHVDALRTLGNRWPLGARFADALEKVHLSSPKTGSPTSTGVQPDIISPNPMDLRLSAFDRDVSGELRPVKNLPQQQTQVQQNHLNALPNPYTHNNALKTPTALNNLPSIIDDQTEPTQCLGDPAMRVGRKQGADTTASLTYPANLDNTEGHSGGLHNVGGLTAPFPEPRPQSASFNGQRHHQIYLGGFTTPPQIPLAGELIGTGRSADTLMEVNSEIVSRARMGFSPLCETGLLTPAYSTTTQHAVYHPTHSSPTPCGLSSLASTGALSSFLNSEALNRFTMVLDRSDSGCFTSASTPGSSNGSSSGGGLFGLEYSGMPGEEYGGPVIDWSIFENLLD